MTIPMLMLLGHMPPRPQTVRGTIHEAEGSRAYQKQQTAGKTRLDKVATRRAEILEMIDLEGPLSRTEIRHGLSMPASEATVTADTVALCASGALRMKQVGQTFIYFLASAA